MSASAAEVPLPDQQVQLQQGAVATVSVNLKSEKERLARLQTAMR